MTEILQSPPHLPSSSSSMPRVPPIDNDGLHQQTLLYHAPLINSSPSYPVAVYRRDTVEEEEGEVERGGVGGGRRERKKREREEGDQLSLLAVLVTAFRKSLVACRSERVEELSSSMEIGLPSNVRHVAHVTFDRFNGFLGLPVEFEPEVPRRPPSASTSAFGVSTESMQLSFDSRGNSVPTILLMMQRHLYAQGGLQAEGIFRINAENGQEEYVRERLNRGIVPDEVDVHCLAGLIKMSDPLTALMYVVQVMNFLKTLIMKTLREREDSIVEPGPISHSEPSDENGSCGSSQPIRVEPNEVNDQQKIFLGKEPPLDSTVHHLRGGTKTINETHGFHTSIESTIPDGKRQSVECSPGEVPNEVDTTKDELEGGGSNLASGGAQSKIQRSKTGHSSNSNIKKGSRKGNDWPVVIVAGHVERSKETSIVSRLNSRTERVESWW